MKRVSSDGGGSSPKRVCHAPHSQNDDVPTNESVQEGSSNELTVRRAQVEAKVNRPVGNLDGTKPSTSAINGVRAVPRWVAQSTSRAGSMRAVKNPTTGNVLYMPVSVVRVTRPTNRAVPSAAAVSHNQQPRPTANVVVQRPPSGQQKVVVVRSPATSLTPSSPQQNGGRVVLPVSATPIAVNQTQVPIQLTTRHYRPSEHRQRPTPPALVSSPPATSRQRAHIVHYLSSGSDWREEQKLILELCEHIDNLPPERYAAFQKNFLSNKTVAMRALALKMVLPSNMRVELTDKTLEGVEEYLKSKRRTPRSSAAALHPKQYNETRPAVVQLAPSVATSGGCKYAIAEPTRPGEAPRLVALVPVVEGEVGDVVVCNSLQASPSTTSSASPRNPLKPEQQLANGHSAAVNGKRGLQDEEEVECDDLFLEEDTDDEETSDETRKTNGDYQNGTIPSTSLLQEIMKKDECDEKLMNVEKLCVHLRDVHGRDSLMREKHFENETLFKKFLRLLEDKGGKFRRARHSVEKAGDSSISYYICQRVNVEKSVPKKKPNGEAKDELCIEESNEAQKHDDHPTIRLDSVCCAFYKKTTRSDGTIHVRYCDAHLHANDLILPKFAQSKIALLLKKKMPRQLVFNYLKDRKEKLLEGEDETEKKRVLALTEQDVNAVDKRLRLDGELGEVDRRVVPDSVDPELYMEPEELEALTKWEMHEGRKLSHWTVWQRKTLEKRLEKDAIRMSIGALLRHLEEVNIAKVELNQLKTLRETMDGILKAAGVQQKLQTEAMNEIAKEEQTIIFSNTREKRVRRAKKTKTETASEELEALQSLRRRNGRVSSSSSSSVTQSPSPQNSIHIPLFKTEIKAES